MNPQNKLVIGWIGLGKMGAPMAANLQTEGFDVTVYNRSVGPAQPFLDRGAKLASSLKEMAQSCDVIVSMISDDAALRSVTIEPGGLFEDARPGLIYVDMSTVSPGVSDQVARVADAKSIQYLRAPVSGSTATAAARALTILVSGPEDVFQKCLPIFEAMGKKTYYLGQSEQSRYLKIAINMMLGVMSAMLAEALVLGERGGVDWEQMIDVFNNSVIASPLLSYKTEMLKKRDFTPMFTSSQMAKDFDLALEAGRTGNLPLPLAAVSRQFVSALISSGRGGLDFFSYVTLLEELSGLNLEREKIEECHAKA